jgi:hypothetical protein
VEPLVAYLHSNPEFGRDFLVDRSLELGTASRKETNAEDFLDTSSFRKTDYLKLKFLINTIILVPRPKPM